MPICHWQADLGGQILCLSESTTRTSTFEDWMAHYAFSNSIQIAKWQFSTGKNIKWHLETLQVVKDTFGSQFLKHLQLFCHFRPAQPERLEGKVYTQGKP